MSDDTGHSFEAYFKRATSPLVVLSLLTNEAKYVYEIAQEMKTKSEGRFTISVLYPVLYRLEEQGFVKVARTEIFNNRARSYYQITEAGMRYLADTIDKYREMVVTVGAFFKDYLNMGALE